MAGIRVSVVMVKNRVWNFGSVLACNWPGLGSGPGRIITDKCHQLMIIGSVKVGTNGATTLSCMNFSGYVGHVTIPS